MSERFGGFVPNMYPIYFCNVGTNFAFSLKMVSTVDCYARLCTKSNLLLSGACQPEHHHFMFVETDDLDKVRELMLPMMGIWDISVTPVKERA